MTPLPELYKSHHGKVSDKWAQYLLTYAEVLEPYRDRLVRILEIGIQNGGSLEFWSEYFQAGVHFVGCDIEPACRSLVYEDPRISVVIGDANDDATCARIREITPDLDIVLDDGSHTSIDIVRAFSRYFPMLTEGGVFIVEDLHCSYWAEFGGGLFHSHSSISFFKSLIDIINHEHWGVDRPRGALIANFSDAYGAHISEELLASIHSVEFLNSMCVIRKRAPEDNVLGSRIVVGEVEAVVPGILAKQGQQFQRIDQSANPLAAGEPPTRDVIRMLEMKCVAFQETLQRLTEELASAHDRVSAGVCENQDLVMRLAAQEKLKSELESVYNSASWRWTRPLRWIGTQLRRGKVRFLRLSEHHESAASELKLRASEFGSQVQRYRDWIEAHDLMTDRKRQELRKSLAALTSRPKISVVMSSSDANLAWLEAAIGSVEMQIYRQWELCIADASSDEQVRLFLARKAAGDSRFKVALPDEIGQTASGLNGALDLASGEWIVLLDQHDVLAEDALSSLAQEINLWPDARLIYSDEDQLDAVGLRCAPFFKPDWSPHLACAQAYLGGMVAFSVKDSKPAFDSVIDGAHEYALWLSMAAGLRPTQIRHIHRVLYHKRAARATPQGRLDCEESGRLAVQAYVNRRYPGLGVQVERGQWMSTYALKIPLPAASVFSIIIPTKDKAELLATCIESIIEQSTWQEFEIIVLNNNSEERATFEYFERVQRADSRVKVIDANIPFNWSRLNNIGARHASGDYLVFLNNDTAIISPNWLEKLGGYARLPDVGVVGAVLLFPDGSIQHAGVVVGMGGWADHVFRTENLEHSLGGNYVSPTLTRNVLAVTGACMVLRKDRFEEIGGFDECFVICGSDVELGIRASKAGYFNVVCAETKLYHYESQTRSAHVPDIDFEQSSLKYAPYRCEQTDPFFNRNLSLASTTPALAGAPRAA